MKRIIKIVCLLLSIILISLSFSGCGNNDNGIYDVPGELDVSPIKLKEFLDEKPRVLIVRSAAFSAEHKYITAIDKNDLVELYLLENGHFSKVVEKVYGENYYYDDTFYAKEIAIMNEEQLLTFARENTYTNYGKGTYQFYITTDESGNYVKEELISFFYTDEERYYRGNRNFMLKSHYGGMILNSTLTGFTFVGIYQGSERESGVFAFLLDKETELTYDNIGDEGIELDY